MRQTNIVWVGMALGMTVIDKFVSQTMPFVKDADKTTKMDSVYTFKVMIIVLTIWQIKFLPYYEQLCSCGEKILIFSPLVSHH